MADVRKTAGSVVAAFVIIAAAWFFVSPLFIDEVVDEQFEFPTRVQIMAMSDGERERAMSRVMSVVETMPESRVDESMSGTDVPTVLKSGTFNDADAIHKGAGDATLYRLPDGSHVLRFENFRVTNGPALVVYLAEHPDPQRAADVSAGYLSLGPLKGNVGNQNYVIPAGTDPSQFGSAVIWCELFDVLFSPAPLGAPMGE